MRYPVSQQTFRSWSLSALIVICVPGLFAEPVNWLGGNDNWTDPAGWNTGMLPDSSADVGLNSGILEVNSAVGAVNSLSHDGTATAKLLLEAGGNLSIGTVSSLTPGPFTNTLTLSISGQQSQQSLLTLGQITAPNDTVYAGPFGTLTLSGSSSASSPVSNSIGTLFTFSGGTVNVNSPTTTQYGQLTLNYFQSGSSSPSDFSNGIVVNGGSLTVGGTNPGQGYTINQSGGIYLQNNATVNLTGYSSNISFSQNSGTIQGYGTLNIGGSMFNSQGTITSWPNDSGGLILNNTAGSQISFFQGTYQAYVNPLTLNGSINFTDGKFQNIGSTLTLNGTDTIGNGSQINGPLTLAGGQTYTIDGGVAANSSSIEVGSGSQVVFTPGSYITGADFLLDAGAVVNSAGGSLQNSIIEGAGTWEATQGYTQTTGTLEVDGNLNAGSSTININGGQLQGEGTITAGDLNVGDATIKPGDSPGIMTINGNLTLNSDSTTLIQYGGTDNSNPSSIEYDAFDVNGTAYLNGYLNTQYMDLGIGYTPSAGDIFTILTCADGCDGEFSGYDDYVSSDERFQIEYNADSVVLEIENGTPDSPPPPPPSAAPEPGTWILMSSGGLLALAWRRRKSLG